MKNVLFLLPMIALFAVCNAQTKNILTLSPTDYAAQLKATPGAQLLDVRTPEEFAAGHLDNAVNVDWLGADFQSKAAKFDKSKPVFVYCKIGGRSAQAAARLSEMGFSKVYDMQGGIVKWEAAGLMPKSDRIIGMCDQEYGEMLKSAPKILVDFNAKWCAPCQKMKPFLEAMKTSYAGKVSIVSLDADENKTMMTALKIEDLPALLLYENGKLVWQHTGYISEEDLKKQL
jgi:rhodanese-related sulfurtransferase